MKLITPKTTSYMDRNIFALDELMRNGGQLTNADLKKSMIKKFPSLSKDRANQVKQEEIARYFGFIDYPFSQSIKKITKTGISFLHADWAGRKKIVQSVLLNKNFSFGKNNHAVLSSDSDVQPPIVLLRLAQELSYVSVWEFGYSLEALHYKKSAFQNVLNNINDSRNKQKRLPLKQTKFKDAKFDIFLNELGIIQSTKSKGEKIYYFDASEINSNFYRKIKKTSILFGKPYSKSKVSRKVKTSAATISVLNSRAPSKRLSSNSPTWATDKKIKDQALLNASYKCEIDPNHVTFPSASGNDFMEGHHVIPMSSQGDFEKINLDRTENIACLCPNCHRSAHLSSSVYKQNVFDALFNKRKNFYTKIGIIKSNREIFLKYYN